MVSPLAVARSMNGNLKRPQVVTSQEESKIQNFVVPVDPAAPMLVRIDSDGSTKSHYAHLKRRR